YVDVHTLDAARGLFKLHDAQSRPMERDHPLTRRQINEFVFPAHPTYCAGQNVSPMRAIDDAFVGLVDANPRLRVRVGNPDELQSNRMVRTLEHLKHRVDRPE